MRHEKAPGCGTLVVGVVVGRILPRSYRPAQVPLSLLLYLGTCRHAQATIPPSSLRWVVCTRPAHPPSLAAKAFSGLGPRLSHCIRAHILYFWPVRVSLRGRRKTRAGCWCGTPDLLELVASRSAIDLLIRRGLLVSGKLGFVTMFFFSLMHILCSFVHRCVRSFSFGSFPPIRVPALSCMSACPPLIIVVSPFTAIINSKTLRRPISLQVLRVPVPFGSVRYLAPPKGASTRSKSQGPAGALHCINILGRVSRRSFLAAKVLGK